MTFLSTLIKKIPAKRQMSWYTLGQVVTQLFSFMGIVLISRYLGPSQLGLYSFVQNYLAAFMTIVAGMDFYFTWKLARSDEKIQELSRFFWHKLHVTSILSVGGMFVGWMILPYDVALLATVIFVPLILNSCTAFFLYAVVAEKAKIIAMVQIVVAAVLFCVKSIFVGIHAPLIAFVAVTALDTVLSAFVIAIIYLSNKHIAHSFFQASRPSIVQTLSFLSTIWLSVAAVGLWQLILRVDQLVLATITNAYSLGLYSAAVKIAEVPNFLAGVLYTGLVTYMSAFAHQDDESSRRRITKVMTLYLLAGGSLAVIIIIFAPTLVAIIYGSKFIGAVEILRVYALSIPGLFLGLHYFGVYGAKERHGEQVIIFTCGLIVNSCLVYALTPVYGLVGAAWSTVATYSALAVIFYYRVR